MLQDRFGNPIDEFGNDLLDDGDDEQTLSLIDAATDEELGFEDEDDLDAADREWAYVMDREDVYFEESYMTGDSDLGNEY